MNHPLPAILHRLLTGSCRDIAWTAGDLLEIWRSTGADDARIANLLRMALPHTSVAADVATVKIVGMPTNAKLCPDVLVHFGGGVAAMPDLVGAARQLLADSAPKRIAPASSQLSLF